MGRNLGSARVAVDDSAASARAVAFQLTSGINLCMRIEGNGRGVLAERLIPVDFALVAIQLVAELAACQVLGDEGALHGSNLVEIVAVVDFDGTARMRQGEAVACARAVFELASGVAIVQDCIGCAVGPAGEAAVHRAAGIAHLAERSAVVEGDVGVVGAQHACIALYACCGLAGNVYIGHYVLHEHCAFSTADEGSEVDGCRNHIALNAQVADGGSVDVSKQTAIVAGDVVAVRYGVALAVERAGILVGAIADHDVTGECDVGSQIGVKSGLAVVHGLSEGFEVGSRLNLHACLYGFVGIELQQAPAARVAALSGSSTLVAVVTHFLLR